jgi:hypothetical protein
VGVPEKTGAREAGEDFGGRGSSVVYGAPWREIGDRAPPIIEGIVSEGFGAII